MSFDILKFIQHRGPILSDIHLGVINIDRVVCWLRKLMQNSNIAFTHSSGAGIQPNGIVLC